MTAEALTTHRRARTAVPAWLGRVLRPVPAPVDGTRVAAAVTAIAGPQAVGWLTGHVDEAALASVGALCVSFADQTSSYRNRIRRVGLTTLLGACGFAAGSAATGWWAALVVVAVSAVSVLSSRLGGPWAAAGAHMLTFCVVATGQHTGSLGLGQQVLWFSTGELLLVAAVAASWPLRRTAPARRSLARVFDTCAHLLGAIGSPHEARNARRELTTELNDAEDVLLSGASTARSRVHDRLRIVLTRATPVVEASVALLHAGNRPPQRAVRALEEIARGVRTGRPPARYPARESGSDQACALDRGIAELIDAWHRATPPARQAPPPLRERIRTWRDAITFGRDAWLLVLRMVLCLTAAELVGALGDLEQSYWVALTVALVLKPNSGSVFARTMLRAAGSVAGVLLAMLLLAANPPAAAVVAAVALLAAAVPVALSSHYGLFTAVVTAMVLLQMSSSEIFRGVFPSARLLDSLIGCAIVLGIAALFRRALRGAPLPVRFASATATVSEYLAQALSGAPHGRSSLRRRTYRELSDLRGALQQRLTGSAPAAAERWWPNVAVLERIVDAATERAVSEQDRDEDAVQNAQRLVSGLRALVRRMRAGEVPPEQVRLQLADLLAGIDGRER